nr:vegetative cell wall protein gp1-like [Aegilops tauschii subsp. strangulata]
MLQCSPSQPRPLQPPLPHVHTRPRHPMLCLTRPPPLAFATACCCPAGRRSQLRAAPARPSPARSPALPRVAVRRRAHGPLAHPAPVPPSPASSRPPPPLPDRARPRPSRPPTLLLASCSHHRRPRLLPPSTAAGRRPSLVARTPPLVPACVVRAPRPLGHAPVRATPAPSTL